MVVPEPTSKENRLKRYLLVPTFVVFASVALLVLAGSVNADPRFHGGRVYVASACQGHKYRPTSIILACGDGGLFATNIRYRSYGGKTAVATVELHTHDCVPNCAQSQFHAFPGTITLADVVRCEGTLYYSRARYRFTNGAPYGEDSSGVAEIEPLFDEEGMIGEIHCSTVLG
jgi:hypothetical protein